MRVLHIPDGRTFLSHDTLGFSDYSGHDVERANVKVASEGQTVELFPMSNLTMDQRPDGEYDWTYRHLTSGPGCYWEPQNPEPDTTAIRLFGGHGSIELWLLDTPEHREMIKGLDDYPCLDEEAVSEVEMDAENEAFTDWIAKDLVRSLPDTFADDVDLPEHTCAGSIPTPWECPACDIRERLASLRSLQEHAEDLDHDALWRLYRQACEDANVYGHCETGGGYYVDVERLAPAFRDLVIEELGADYQTPEDAIAEVLEHFAIQMR